MNLVDNIKTRLDSRLAIRQANQTIQSEKSTMNKKFGFTAEDREVIKANGGKLGPWLEWRKSKNEAAKKSAATLAKKPAPALSATKPAPAASKPATVKPAARNGGNGAFVPSPIPTMSKAAFDQLSPRDKSRFSTTGGKIVEATGNGAFVATQIPTLSKAEFDALSNRDKSRFSLQGGKIVESQTAKPHRDASGTLTRAGLAAMSPADRTAHFKAGGKLVD